MSCWARRSLRRWSPAGEMPLGEELQELVKPLLSPTKRDFLSGLHLVLHVVHHLRGSSFGSKGGLQGNSICFSQCRAPQAMLQGDTSRSGRAQMPVPASQRNLFCFLFVGFFSSISCTQPRRLSSSCSVTPRSHQTLQTQIREQQWQTPWCRQAKSQIYCSYESSAEWLDRFLKHWRTLLESFLPFLPLSLTLPQARCRTCAILAINNQGMLLLLNTCTHTYTQIVGCVRISSPSACECLHCSAL